MQNDDEIFYHIRSALRGANGERQAVTLSQIADFAGTSRRQVEKLLEERLELLGFVIVSGSPGLWRPTQADEINHYQASLQSRLRKLAIRKRSIRRLATREGYVPTGKLFQDPPALQGELF